MYASITQNVWKLKVVVFFSQGFTVFRGKNSPCAESPKTAKGDQQSQRTEGMNTLSRIVLLSETSGDFDDGKKPLA